MHAIRIFRIRCLHGDDETIVVCSEDSTEGAKTLGVAMPHLFACLLKHMSQLTFFSKKGQQIQYIRHNETNEELKTLNLTPVPEGLTE